MKTTKYAAALLSVALLVLMSCLLVWSVVEANRAGREFNKQQVEWDRLNKSRNPR